MVSTKCCRMSFESTRERLHHTPPSLTETEQGGPSTLAPTNRLRLSPLTCAETHFRLGLSRPRASHDGFMTALIAPLSYCTLTQSRASSSSLCNPSSRRREGVLAHIFSLPQWICGCQIKVDIINLHQNGQNKIPQKRRYAKCVSI